MKSRTAKLLTAGAFILAAASLAFAVTASAEVIGRVSAAEGNVDLLSPGRTEAVPVKGGEDVSAGDILRTKSISKAELTFFDKSVVTLSEKTRLEIKDYRVGLDGKRIAAVLNIERGKIRAVVSKAPGKDNFLINTPNASGSVKGTDLVVAYQKSATSATVLNGSLSFSSSAVPEKKVEIKSGESSVIVADSEPTYPRTILAMERTAHEKDTMIAKAPAGGSATAEGYSEPGEMKAVIVKLSGSVKVKNGGSAVWHDAKVNETLKTGDTIETNKNGKAEFRVENGDVITLQQDSNFTITRLKETGSGEHESLFESKKGKLRAKVEKLKGNSKFEVKTPTSVASVRGTIIFLNISSTQTQSYFEDGNGVLKNLISGTIKNVPMGTSSTADGNGNVTDPVEQNDDQKSKWNEGWDVGEGEGYSPPGEDTSGGSNTYNTEMHENFVFGDKPVTELIGQTNNNGGEGNGGEGGGEETTYMTGTVKGSFGYQERSEDNFIDMSFNSITPLDGQWSGQMDINVTGNHIRPDHVVFTGDVTGSGVGGGEFAGWLGGIDHSWDAAAMSIYIDPSGRAGWFGTAYVDPNGGDTVFDILSGTCSFDGSLAGSGSLYFTQVAQLEPGVKYFPEYGSGSGDLRIRFDNGNGYFDAEFDREMMRIPGQDWGIWREAYYYGDYYNSRPLANWNGVAGGYYNDGYFFSSVRGIDDGTGGLRMDMTGAYLDYYTLGAYFGTILAYEEEGIEATGVGGFIESPLSFSGDWGYYEDDLYNDYGERGMGGAGGQYGRIGSSTPDWWQASSFPVTAIGEYYIYYREEPFIWNTSINSYNAKNDDSTSIGDGAFIGLSIGIWKNGIMSDGSIYAFYAAPDGTTGLLKGTIGGAYSDLIDMWLAEGTLYRQAKDGFPVDPAYLSDRIQWSEMPYMDFGGAFRNVEYQENWMNEASLYSIGGNPWGIFNMKMGGEFYRAEDDYTLHENGIAMGLTGHDYGLLIKSTDVSLNDEKVIGTLNGVYIDLGKGIIGRLSGDLRGVYYDDIYYGTDEFGNDYSEYYGSSWIASGLGEWEKKPLAYVGVIAGGPDGSGGAFGYFDSWEETGLYLDYETSYLNGVFGGSQNLYGGPAEFAMVGEFYNPDFGGKYEEGDNYKLWRSDFYLTDETSTARGSIGGTDINNKLKGGLVGIYIRDTGVVDDDGYRYRAGYIMSSDENGNPAYLTGDFYPSIGIYDALGKVKAYLDIPTAYSPDILYEPGGALQSKDFEYEIRGDITGTLYVEGLRLDGQDWSILRAVSGGDINTEASGAFSAFMAERNTDWYDDIPSPWYSFLFIDGNFGENGEITGAVHGYDLNATYLGESFGFFLGDYDADEGTWEALSLGVWVENELTASGWAEGGMNDKDLDHGWFDPWNDPEDFSGSFNGLMGSIDPEWKNTGFKTVAMGDYAIYEDADSYLVTSLIGSHNAYATDGCETTTLDGEGAFFGWAHAAIGNSADGRLLDTASGLRLAAIYIASNDEGGNDAGILRGPLDLDLYELPDQGDSEVGMWIAEGYITPTVMETGIGLTPDQLVSNLSIETGVLEGSGTGTFLGGEIINQADNQFEMTAGDRMQIDGPGHDWGIMQAMLVGRAEAAAVIEPTWNMAIGGTSYSDSTHEVVDGYYLISARGDVSDTTFDGAFKGVYFGVHEGSDDLYLGRTTGDVVGIYQEGGPEVDTTFQAQMLGEWVDLAQITTDQLGFTQQALAAMVEVPITETYTALLQNANVGGNIDLSVYDNRIFTAIVDLTFADLPTAGQTFNFTSGADNLGLTLTDVNTVAMTWTADALGQINNMNAAGSGGGLITPNGTSFDFDGVIAGPVTPPVTP
ncbi:MAG: FecR family protein [Candidatus Omnitrophota bacterium]|jgi:hypothetical protein